MSGRCGPNHSRGVYRSYVGMYRAQGQGLQIFGNARISRSLGRDSVANTGVV